MKQKLQHLLILLFFTMTASVAWAQSGYVIKSNSGANLRSGAGADFKVVTSIPAGSRVKVLEQGNNGWNKVEYQGQTGYVSATLIEKEGEQQRNANSSNSSNGGSSQSGSRPSYASSNNNNNNGNNGKSNNSKSNSNNSKSGNTRSSSSNSGGQNWGLGLRGGDPAGITLKKYRGNGSALEFVLGRSFRWGYKYDDRFYRYNRFDDRNLYNYKGYKRDGTTALQVHYLLHKDINGANGLQFYYGGGGQVRFTPVYYTYKYKNESVYLTDRVTDLDLGLDAVLGLEYTFREIPFSIFVDVNAFVEVYDVPFWISGQSGAGIRFNF